MSESFSKNARKILNILSENRCHLTAEDIIRQMENVGTATVYRALETLEESGQIRKLSISQKTAVYEYVRENHAHLVCRQCGKVVDIAADFSRMIAEAAKCCGHLAEWADVTAYGTCSDCLALQSAAEEQE